jgi:hypothetical protein
MPTINLTDDELAAVVATVRRAIEDDKFPHAPRLDPLRAALARLEAAAATKETLQADRPQVKAAPKAPPPAKSDKRARRYKLRQKQAIVATDIVRFSITNPVSFVHLLVFNSLSNCGHFLCRLSLR